jgi:hypothetical protein
MLANACSSQSARLGIGLLDCVSSQTAMVQQIGLTLNPCSVKILAPPSTTMDEEDAENDDDEEE